jgi:hypothetical protein
MKDVKVHKYSIRVDDFENFSKIVVEHIRNYTIPQYGDAPHDQIQNWTPEQCMDSIKRYVNRFSSNRRGRIEQLRDLAKIAHLAAIIFDKLEPEQEEIDKIEEGRS